MHVSYIEVMSIHGLCEAFVTSRGHCDFERLPTQLTGQQRCYEQEKRRLS